LHKLDENTRAVIRKELGEANRAIVGELREITNTNTNVVEMLIAQERRMGRMEAALESIRACLAECDI
jgi:uncharacterized protein involved in exopolysaccharide biosynthesis